MQSDSTNHPTYRCTIGGQPSGPYTLAQLQEMAKAGTLSPTDVIWQDEQPVPAVAVAGLFAAMPSLVPDSEFRYWAFISYSSKDVKLAIQLHRQLETYRIPSTLVGRPGRDGPLPRKLFPIFRDRDELPMSSDLGTEIRKALKGSRYLIVLCTPDAAKSQWVNEEIRYFKSLGRDDRISGIIAKGIPNGSANPATAEQECFPTALMHGVDRAGVQTVQKAEPLAADLRKSGDGWRNAYLKAVAGITGVGFDAFAKREAKRTLRRRVALSIVGVLFLALALFYWDYSRLKVAHYAFVGERWGVPVGIIPLNDQQRAGREVAYRVETRGYRVRSVYRVNSVNTPLEDTEYGTTRTDVVYREDGSVERLQLRDKNNRIVVQKTYSKLAEPNELLQRACTINFLSKGDYAQPLRGDVASLSSALSKSSTDTSKSNISVHEVLFDQQGRLEIVLFRNSYGSPASDANGVFGQKHEYNEMGLIVRTINLDAKGQPMPDRKGVQRVDRERLPNGAIARLSSFDADNHAVINPDFIATMEYVYDDAGNQTEWRCLDATGAPTLHKDGYHRAVFDYDANGVEIRKAYFDLTGKPTLHRDGYARAQTTVDERGLATRIDYFGIDGKPTIIKNGYASTTMQFDERNNFVGGACYDVNGKLVISVDGWAQIRSTVDTRGNVLETRLFDTAEKPTISKYGVHRMVSVYDERDNRIESRYFGIDDAPTVNNEGIFGMLMAYDERGNLIEENYIGLDEQPVLHKNGMARLTNRYDDHGNLVERAYFGLKGDPITHNDGYARYTQRFDDRGHKIEVAYFNTLGEPTLSRNGYAKRRSVYDDLGREVRTDYFGTTGQPILNDRGIARAQRVLDVAGNIVEEAYFDTHHRLTTNVDDVAIIRTKWDTRGNIMSTKMFGKSGRPVEHKKYKFFHSDMTYDDRGNQTSVAFFGNGGVPIKAGADEVARRTRQYDARNNIIEERYFGIDGKPTNSTDGCAIMRATYDERDNRIGIRYYDVNDLPVISKLGMARTQTIYDARSRRIEEAYFDLSDKWVLDFQGVARLTATYDAYGNVTGQAYFGATGQPVLCTHGFSRSEAAYDLAGNLIDITFFGVDGRPIQLPSGEARQTCKYDKAGRQLEIAFYGADGAPCINNTVRMARGVFRYDRNGHKIAEACFGSDGKPTRGNGGYARLEMVFDERGNNTVIAYYDENDNPVLNFQGAARSERTFDRYGNAVELRLYGIDGALKNSSFGFARLVQTRNAAGRLIDRSTYDAEGKLAIWNDADKGYARTTWKYDDQGDIAEEAYFGADNKPIASRPNGIARAEMRYHASGQLAEVRRFGADGKPLQSDKLGYLEECQYDDSGKMTEYRILLRSSSYAAFLGANQESSKSITRYDAVGNLVASDTYHFIAPAQRGKGTAVQEHQILDAGNHRIGTKYYDEQGKLAIGPNGCAVETITNNEFGLAVRVVGLDDKGQRVKQYSLGGAIFDASRIDLKYDAFGRVIEYLMFDADDKPPVGEATPYRATEQYGPRGKSIESTQYYQLPPNAPRPAAGSAPIRKIFYADANGNPIGFGVHREYSGSKETGDLVCVAQRYDMKSRELELRFYGMNEQPVIGPFGFAKRVRAYDKNGLLLELRYEGIDKPIIPPGEPAAAMVVRRDADGRELETRWFGVDSQLRENADGVAVVRKKWDDKGREAETTYFDRQEKPTRHFKLGVVRIAVLYDDMKNTREERYFDGDGKPMASALGTFRRTMRLDARSRPIEERFFDAEGRPMRSNDGVAGILKKYGDGAQPIEAIAIDEMGKPCKSVYGYSKTLYERDARGNAIREEYFDEAGKPAPPTTADGFNCVVTAYDTANRPRTKTWTITGGKTLPGHGKVAKLSSRLDDRGNAVEVKYLDADDQPTLNANGIAIFKAEYDSRGRPVSDRYFDAAQRPAMFKGQYHQMTQRYEGDRTAEILYRDTDNNPVNGPTGFARLVRTVAAGGTPTWQAFDANGGSARTEVYIEAVVPNGQAAKAGLIAKDILVSYNGVPIVHQLQLIEAVDLDGPATRPLVVDRGGQRLTLTVPRGRLGIALKTRGK